MKFYTFKQFARIIHENFGIHYSYKKKLVLQNRIDARLKELNLKHYTDYLKLLEESPKELKELANKITTNTTYFFREPEHFDFLRRVVFNEIAKEKYATARIWSAPCSSGQEIYSIAIEAADFQAKNTNFSYKIYGSDLSEPALKKARNAIYPLDEISKIKQTRRDKYFDPIEEMFKVSLKIRQRCIFYRMNFLEDDLSTQTKFNVIFCRNMLMYFKKEEQEKIVNKLCERLQSGGYFIISRNESIHGLDVPLKRVEHSIFQKI